MIIALYAFLAGVLCGGTAMFAILAQHDGGHSKQLSTEWLRSRLYESGKYHV